MLLIITLVLAVQLTNSGMTFDNWVLKTGKQYKTQQEYDFRKHVWNDRYKKINLHNSQNHSYTMAINKFSDLTFEEFANLHLMQPKPITQHKSNKAKNTKPVNWVVNGYVPEVNNQLSCGSCWAFSAAETLAAHYAIKNNHKAPVLSPQELLDCVPMPIADGCNGGWPHLAMQYALDTLGGGLEAWHNYKYVANQQECNTQNRDKTIKVNATHIVNITNNNQTELLNALYDNGPISICLYVNENFVSYSSGIYSDALCNPDHINHAVLLYGLYYDELSHKYVYMVRNSWGQDTEDQGIGWGNNGDIYMDAEISDGNICNILTLSSYVV